MQPDRINFICSVVTILAGTLVLVWYVLRRPKQDDTIVEVEASRVVRNYSIYIDAEKVGTCISAGLLLDAEETQLTFDQIVPMSAPHFRKLQRAFRNRERLSVSIGPLDDGLLDLGLMRVDMLLLDADMNSCSTSLQTTLSGPTLVLPVEFEQSATLESIAETFTDIEIRAERAKENTSGRGPRR